MMLKKLLILSILLLGAGCSAVPNDSTVAELRKDCASVAESQGRNEGWVQRCSTSRSLLNDALKGEVICKEWGKVFGRDADWISECTLTAARAQEQVIDIQFMRMKPDQLCRIVWAGYGGLSGKLAQSIAEERNLNCSQKISDWAREVLTQMPVDKLCRLWINKSGHPAYYKEVEEEVKRKGYKCEAL